MDTPSPRAAAPVAMIEAVEEVSGEARSADELTVMIEGSVLAADSGPARRESSACGLMDVRTIQA